MRAFAFLGDGNADLVLDPSEGHVVDRIIDLTDGVGVDAAIEAYGFPETFEAAIRATKPQIRTSLCPGGSERLNRLFRLMLGGRVDPMPMTTHTFAFDDVPTAFTLIRTKAENVIKPARPVQLTAHTTC